MNAPGERNPSGRTVEAQQGRTGVSRRLLVQAAAASSPVGALAFVGARGRAASSGTSTLDSASLEIVTTDAPLRVYADRSVRDRMTVHADRPDEWQSAELGGEKPEHRVETRVRYSASMTEMAFTFLLHDQPARTINLRVGGDLSGRRLWIGKDYVHLDLGRTRFPELDVPEAFTDHLWFATFPPNADAPSRVVQPSYTYRRPEGFLGLPIAGGHRYEFEWQTHADGINRDYRTAWLRDETPIAELTESVFPANGRGAILPLPISLYLETPELSCCTAKTDEWACC